MEQQAQGAGRRTARRQAQLSTPARAAAGRGGRALQRTQQLPCQVSAKAAQQTPHAAGPSSPGPPQQENGTCLRKSKRASAGAHWQQVLEQVQGPLRAAQRQHSASGKAGGTQRAIIQPHAPQLGRRLMGRQGGCGRLPGRAQGPKASAQLIVAARDHFASQKRQASSEAQDATAVTEQASNPEGLKPRTSLKAQQVRGASERASSWTRPRREAARGVQRVLDDVRRPWRAVQAEARKRPLTTGDTQMWPQGRSRWGRPAGGAVPAQPCAAAPGAASLGGEGRFQAHATSTAASRSGLVVTAEQYPSGLRLAAQQPGSFSHAHTRQQRQISPAATADCAADFPSTGSLAAAAVPSQQRRGVQQFLHVTASHQIADMSTSGRPLHRSPVAQEVSPGKPIRQRAQQLARRQAPVERASKLPASGYKRKQPGQYPDRQTGDGTQALQPSIAAEDNQNKASRLLYSSFYDDAFTRHFGVRLCHVIGHKAHARQPLRI